MHNPRPYKEKYKWQVDKENNLFELPKAQIWCESVHLQTWKWNQAHEFWIK